MRNYLGLMKLRVVELLLVTTVPALFIASEGIPSISVTFWSLLGGTLAAGGANAFNIVIEADSDRLMNFLCIYYHPCNHTYRYRNYFLCPYLYNHTEAKYLTKYCLGWHCWLYASPNRPGCSY